LSPSALASCTRVMCYAVEKGCMDPQVNPFAVLSFIVAPAVLTNASSVLSMSTSNRLARAVDRARELARQLEAAGDLSVPEAVRRRRELAATEQRTLMLLSTLRSFYVALGSFASAALVSLLGAVFVPIGAGVPVQVLEVVGVVAGFLAVSALVHGAVVLVRETRIAVQVVQERAASIHARVGSVLKAEMATVDKQSTESHDLSAAKKH